MTITEFKRIVSALTVYASSREKATGPESYIGVQVKDGVLKLIASSSVGGVVATAGLVETANQTFVIEARPLISASKALKGKLQLHWEVGSGGLKLVSDKGGSIDCRSVGSIKDAGFAKKPREVRSTAFVSDGEFGRIAKVFDAVQMVVDFPPPTLDFYDSKVVLTAVDPVSQKAYANVKLEGVGEAHGAAYMEFWRSLKALEAAGTIDFCADGVVASAGIFECYSAPYRVSYFDKKTRTSSLPDDPKPHPEMSMRQEAVTVSVSIDRKQLIEAIKGQMPNDELGRITLQVDTGTIQVYPYGAEVGITLPASTFGRGVRSVQAEVILSLLRNIDSKEVDVAWGNPSPAIRLSGKDYDNWTILIAPISMNN